MSDGTLVVRDEVFRSSFDSWDSLLTEAAERATPIGLSHSEDKEDGVVTIGCRGEPDSADA